MQNLTKLLEEYSQDSRILKLASLLTASAPQAITLEGLAGSSVAFVIAGSWMSNPRQMVIIANNQEEAAYMFNNLDNIFTLTKVHYLPDSFKKPGNFDQISSTQVLQRTEVVNYISESDHDQSIIITYPEALFEKVVSPDSLKDHRIIITKSEPFDAGFLIEILSEYGFERTDFVFEPGQFSVRGGILDIYSFGNEWPYRVELYGDDVESIRLFDPVTQLSQKTVSKVVIVPHVGKKFEHNQKQSFFDLLAKNAILYIADEKNLVDVLQNCFEASENIGEKIRFMDDDEKMDFIRDRSFIRPGDVISASQQFTRIGYAGRLSAGGDNILFGIKPQPSFNKNFKLLIQSLEENQQEGLENYLFTDNPRQIDRFEAIFNDLEANVVFSPVTKGIEQGFIDPILRVACYTDHQIFDRYHAYNLRKGFTKDMAINLRMLRELQPGDFVTHIDHGVGKYSGLEKININGHVQESVRLIYKNNDILYVSINSLHKISKYVGKDGTEPVLNRLGSDAWKNLKAKTKKKVKDIAGELIKLYAKRRASTGHSFPPDGYLQNELEASFLYEDTPDQYKTTNEVKADMEKDYPMDRLICGDVGFGKTEIALRAAFKSVTDGKQVAVLVPTTILALQHYKTFSERLEEFGVTVDYINRFRTNKEKKEIIEKTKNGKIEIIIGTHSLVGKEIEFKDLGLLIVDEEQKFGVSAKEKLRSLKVNVDTLTLTATPIPRTLQFSLMGARDFSVIKTPPPNRQPIHTERWVWDEEKIREAINYEKLRGGQVFFVHNRVKSLEEVAAVLKRMCPDVSIGVAHGQLEPEKLEEILVGFIEKKYDVLACTNIIETGLDIPNANTIIINNAHQFGLSDLHQLRGRVGRSNKKAFCYLMGPPLSGMTSDARKRIQTLEEFTDLGSGFTIAMRDLDIRGAGNLLGAEQSGFIADIGFEIFQKILDEAITELRHGEFKEVFAGQPEETAFVRDVIVETDQEMLIPDEYVSNVQERLALYTELDQLTTEEELKGFADRILDRFGRIPPQVRELMEGLRLRWIAKNFGFERIIIKGGKLRCYFISNPQSAYYETGFFKKLLNSIPEFSLNYGIQLKQSNNALILVKDKIHTLGQTKDILERMYAALQM